MFRKLLFLLIGFVIFISGSLQAESYSTEKQLKAALRRIGNEILWAQGDSLSQVKPVERQASIFELKFESEFSFDPGDLATIVDRELERSGLKTAYILEVKDCHRSEVVYSYQMFDTDTEEIIPCKGRLQQIGCYRILIEFEEEFLAEVDAVSGSWNARHYLFFLPLGLFIVILFFWFRPKKAKGSLSEQEFTIGQYHFRPERGELRFQSLKQELTGKESELLLTLCQFQNKTISREAILQSVWGDDGDYVGRTLDVFISRLRKKLAHDPMVKIQNIRGVGYRLIA